MLEQFVALESGTDEDIARYARKWGLLGVERFRDTGSRQKYWSVSDQRRSPQIEKINGKNIAYGWERLAYWRFWIGKFAAAIRTGSRLSENKHPLQRDWETILDIDDCRVWEGWKKPLKEIAWKLWRDCQATHFRSESARITFFSWIMGWQKAGAVNLYLDPVNNRLQIRTGSLFSGLVWQLMAAVCSSTGVAICSECGATYQPERKPAFNKRAYCPPCVRDKAPQRNAARAWCERQRQENNRKRPRARREK
jgi:hypothetical protein